MDFCDPADAVQLEESVYLAATDGPRRTVQIVIYGHVASRPSVRWSLRHTPPRDAGCAPPSGRYEPELPLRIDACGCPARRRHGREYTFARLMC